MVFQNDGTYNSILTDFDLAWHTMDSIISNNQRVKSLLSTLSYASPEFRRNPESEQSRNRLTDIYSFGQLMYFVFTGSDPSFSYQENLPLLQQKLREWPIAKATDIFQDLYHRCTAQSPANRIQSMKDIERDLLEIARLVSLGNIINTPKDFLEQLMFMRLGVDRKESIAEDALEANYLAANGKIRLVIEIKNLSKSTSVSKIGVGDIRITISAEDEVVLEGAHNFVDSKRLLKNKIENLCKQEKLAMGRVNTVSFSTDITAQSIPLDDSHVKKISTILDKVSEFFVTKH